MFTATATLEATPNGPAILVRSRFLIPTTPERAIQVLAFAAQVTADTWDDLVREAARIEAEASSIEAQEQARLDAAHEAAMARWVATRRTDTAGRWLPVEPRCGEAERLHRRLVVDGHEAAWTSYGDRGRWVTVSRTGILRVACGAHRSTLLLDGPGPGQSERGWIARALSAGGVLRCDLQEFRGQLSPEQHARLVALTDVSRG
jgi:hypothetical protein